MGQQIMKHAYFGVPIILAGALLAGTAFAHQEPAPASAGAAGEIVARLPWGKDAAAVGGTPTNGADSGIEGVPASFLVDEAGAVHILDTVNRRIVVLKPGAPPATVSLAALGDASLLVDFAVRGRGWLVADRTANAVVEVGPDGAAGTRWTGFQRLQRVDTAGDRAFARDEMTLSVSRLDAGGKLEEASKSPHAVPVTAGGGPVMARVVAAQAVFTLGPKDSVYSLPAHQSGDEVQAVEVAGADANGALLLAIHEGKGDERRGVWLSRVAPDGDVQAELLAPPIDDRCSTPPRFFRALADGKVLGFRTTEASYELARFTLVPPASPRRAAPAAAPGAAEESARTALCKGDASARAAVAAAALAVAFDETASRRVERDLAALDAGVKPADLCALDTARAALESGDAAKALKTVEAIDAEGLRDRRLYIEAQALEKTGDLREGLHRWQRLVLEHADSPHFAEAQAAVMRIADSGKLPGAQPK